MRCFIETMLEAELSEALSRPRPAQAGRGRGGGDDSASPMRGEMADLSFSPPRRSPLLRNAASFKALRHVICLGFLLVRVFRLSTRGMANPSTSWKHQPDDKALTGAAKRPILDAIAVNSAWPARRSVIAKHR